MRVSGYFLCNNNQKLILTYGGFMDNRIKSLIVLRFGSQTDFAKEVNNTESFVSRVVRGRTPLSEEMKKKWVKALGKKAQSILDTEKK